MHHARTPCCFRCLHVGRLTPSIRTLPTAAHESNFETGAGRAGRGVRVRLDGMNVRTAPNEGPLSPVSLACMQEKKKKHDCCRSVPDSTACSQTGRSGISRSVPAGRDPVKAPPRKATPPGPCLVASGLLADGQGSKRRHFHLEYLASWPYYYMLVLLVTLSLHHDFPK
jgi:hypothetical protein